MADQETQRSRSSRARHPSERSRDADEQCREQLASQNDAALCEADVLIASASGSTKARGVPLSHHSPPARHTQGFPRRPRVPTCTRAAPAPRVAGAMEAYVRRPRPAAGRCAKGRPHRSSGATQDRRPPSCAPSFPSACSSSTARTSIRARPTYSRPQSVSSVRRARCASRTSMATQANVCCTLAMRRTMTIAACFRSVRTVVGRWAARVCPLYRRVPAPERRRRAAGESIKSLRLGTAVAHAGRGVPRRARYRRGP